MWQQDDFAVSFGLNDGRVMRQCQRFKTSFTSGDLLGIPEVLAGGNWSLTAVADGPATVQPFGAARLFQSLEDMPDAHSDFLRHIAAMA